MIDLKKWKLYQNYNFDEHIVPLSDNPENTSVDLGEGFTIGKSFIRISDDRDNTLSFVLSGFAMNGIYKLIWKG